MSTKGVEDSKNLEADLTRELEQDAAGDQQEPADEAVVESTRNRRSSSEVSQIESTDQNKKIRRSRPKPIEPKPKPKRRKTCESEESDLSENVTTDNVQPVAGPSSGVISKSKDDRSSSIARSKDIPEDKNDEEMEAQTSEATDSSDRASDLDVSTAADTIPSEIRVDKVMEEEAPTSSSFRLAKRLQVEQAAEKALTSNIRRDRFTPPSAQSAVLEEIFRMPIFESDSRRSVYDGEDRFNESKDSNNLVDQEMPGPSRPTDRYSRREIMESRPNEGLEERKDIGFLQQEKQNMMWARKVFFKSTELIFPGFAQYADAQSKTKECMAVRVRSSWVLQALLYADLLFFIMWFLAFLSTFDIAVTVLKELHGNLVLCMTALFTLVNIPRLLFGLKGNESDKMEFLALFWMMTFIVQAPLFGFILFTDVFTPIRLAFTLTMDSIMMVFIVLEIVVGTLHLKDLIRDELKVIQLAKKSENLLKAREHDGNLRPRIINTADGPIVDWLLQNKDVEDISGGRNGPSIDSEDDWSTDESFEEEFSRNALDRDPAVDYRVKIRRLRTEELEEPERDDSNQVSSTSDSIRQRQVRVI